LSSTRDRGGSSVLCSTVPLTTTRAILVRRLRLTESSLIVTWCSESHGLIKTVAKGALRPKSPFAGRLDLFLSADLAYAESRRSDLHALREIQIAQPRFGLRDSWRRVNAASYFVHLIEQVAERATPIPEIYDLLARGLDFLESKDPDHRAVLHFERELAKITGVHTTSGGAAIEGLRQTFHFSMAPRDQLLRSLQSSVPPATSSPPQGS
jgi:DNA repair protein RecO (recombination protein O)